MTDVIDYSTPGPFTDLRGISPNAFEGIAGEPAQICWPVHSLVIQPADAGGLGIPPDRFAANQFRPASRIVDALLTLDASPLAVPRDPSTRVVGTCRHFAVLSCALLRRQGIAARARCGFATYFQPGQALDHWITEYWHDGNGRWVRVDTEVLGTEVLTRPDDLRPGEFLTGDEAWAAFRAGRVDAATFGVYGTSNFGPAEIRGNAVKDLAALNKAEMLPWDEWGRMTASYRGETGPDYDKLNDTVAAVAARDDPAKIAGLYAFSELSVPADLLC